MPNWLSTSATEANKLSGASTDTFAALTSTTVNAAAGVTTAGLNAGSNFIKANIPTNTTQTIINSQLNILDNVSSIVYVSAIPGTVFSSLNAPKGMAPFFVKQKRTIH